MVQACRVLPVRPARSTPAASIHNKLQSVSSLAGVGIFFPFDTTDGYSSSIENPKVDFEKSFKRWRRRRRSRRRLRQ